MGDLFDRDPAAADDGQGRALRQSDERSAGRHQALPQDPQSSAREPADNRYRQGRHSSAQEGDRRRQVRRAKDEGAQRLHQGRRADLPTTRRRHDLPRGLPERRELGHHRSRQRARRCTRQPGDHRDPLLSRQGRRQITHPMHRTRLGAVVAEANGRRRELRTAGQSRRRWRRRIQRHYTVVVEVAGHRGCRRLPGTGLDRRHLARRIRPACRRTARSRRA